MRTGDNERVDEVVSFDRDPPDLDGHRTLLEAIRASGFCSRYVFASSIAVYGATGNTDEVGDSTRHAPQTTYGMTKSIGELLVNDYTRKGFIDGRSARLGMVVVRPQRQDHKQRLGFGARTEARGIGVRGEQARDHGTDEVDCPRGTQAWNCMRSDRHWQCPHRVNDRISSHALQADGSVMAEPTMSVDHVGDAVACMAGLPSEANVPFMTVLATNMPYGGRG